LLFGKGIAALFASSNHAIDTCLAIQLSGGPTFEVNNPPPLVNSVVRSDSLFTELAKSVACKVDISGIFHATAGMPLDTYVDMTIGTLSHFLSRERNQLLLDPGQAVLNPNTFFGSLTGDLSEKFWNKESASLDQLKVDLAKPSPLQPYHDFVAFRRKPFIRFGENAVISMNPGFVQEKLESGLFWAIVNELSEDRRQPLFETWGDLFQSYVDRLLRSAVQGQYEMYLPFPKFKKKEHSHESFDAVILSGQKCAVIECKAGFLKGFAKYAEDRSAFLDDLDKKFGGTPGGGIEQLVRKISQLFDKKPDTRRQVDGIDPTQIGVVIPVMVVQEPFVASMFTAPWLSKRFRDLMRKKTGGLLRKVMWTGLVVIHIEELERLCAHVAAGHVLITECLSNRTSKGDPGSGHRIFTFWDSVQDLLKQKSAPPLQRTAFDDHFRTVLDRVCLRFFGQRFAGGVESAHG
jgi:hypothetical protein